MTKHIETRHKLRSISSLDEFNHLIDKCVLSDEERSVVYAHYVNGKPLGYIADSMGFSVSTVKRIHSKALGRLAYLLDE